MRERAFFTMLLVLLTGCATPQPPAASIVLDGPAIVRNAPEAGPDVQAAGYVRLKNTGDQPDRLIALACACADQVQMHSTFNRAMHVLPHLEIPPNGALEVIPGGPTHLMLMGVRAPIAVGEVVRIRLEFALAGPIELAFVAVDNSQAGWRARDTRQ